MPTINTVPNINVFSIADMEVIMKGGTLNKDYGYRRVTYNTGVLRRTTALSNVEKDRIRNYTVLNVTNFEKNCNLLDETVNTSFTEIINELRDLKDKCGADVLSLSGATMQDDFEEVAQEIENYILQVNEYTDALIERGKSVSSQQETICNDTINLMNKIYENNKPEVTVMTTNPNLK